MLTTFKKRLTITLLDKKSWLSFFTGLCLVLAYAPFSQWWLMLFVPACWFYVINKNKPKSAAKYGFIFAFGWFISGISWIHVSIEQFGGLPLVISILLIILLCAYLALYPALACYLSARFAKNQQLNLWLFLAFWLITEYCRGTFLTGFPWLSLGYSQINSPLAAFAPVIGETGITSIIIIININIYQMVTCLFSYYKNHCKYSKESGNTNTVHLKSNLIRTSLFLFIIILMTTTLQNYTWVEPKNKKITAALVQGNIQQELKWLPEQEWPTMLKYLDLSRINYDADLIIWPESAVPSFEATVQDYLTTVNKSAALNNSAIITGILDYNYDTKEYFNNLIVLGKKHKTDEQGHYFYHHSNRYSKNHLLPIGEFVPFAEILRPLAPLFNLPMSSFSRGNYQQPNLIANDLRILPLICFEIAFPQQLSANLFNDTDLLLTVSNDAWFGRSHGPHQHLEIAQMRALEFGRPLLRATNTGISAIIDHQGNITHTMAQFTEGVLKGEVQLVTGTTPYKQWGWLYQWFLVLFIFVSYLGINYFKDKKANI